MAKQEAPVGRSTLAFLDEAAQAPDLGSAYREAVLANVASFAPNVRVVLAKVVLGEADAGIVAQSDAAQASAAQVTTLDIPEPLNIVTSYPIAVVADSPHAETAHAFVAFVLSPAGQHVLADYGFMPAR
jgi:molybdate transport system substrate-binding protein